MFRKFELTLAGFSFGFTVNGSHSSVWIWDNQSTSITIKPFHWLFERLWIDEAGALSIVVGPMTIERESRTGRNP